MAKLFLLSILIGMIALPARAASYPNARAGLRKMLVHVAIWYGFYLFGLLFLYGKSGTVHTIYVALILAFFKWLSPVEPTGRRQSAAQRNRG